VLCFGSGESLIGIQPIKIRLKWNFVPSKMVRSRNILVSVAVLSAFVLIGIVLWMRISPDHVTEIDNVTKARSPIAIRNNTMETVHHQGFVWTFNSSVYDKSLAATGASQPTNWIPNPEFLDRLKNPSKFKVWNFGPNDTSARSVGSYQMKPEHPMYKPPGDKRLLPVGEASALKRLCEVDKNGNPLHYFASVCSKDYFAYPWCGSYDDKVHMLEIQDAYVLSEDVISYWTYSNEYQFLARSGLVWDYVKNIQHYEVLAAPHVSYYEMGYGHWPLEELTNVLFMWEFAPPQAVMILPPSSSLVVNRLIQAGLIPKRPWIAGNTLQKKVQYHARVLYLPFVQSYAHVATNPHGIFLANKYLSQIIAKKKEYIFVARRPGQVRAIIQHNQLVERLRQEFPQYEVRHGVPEQFGDFFAQCELFHNAKMIISSHAGALASLICSQRGQIVVEIGFDHFWPEDHQCTGRHMGVKYILMFADHGGRESALSINVDRIINELKKLGPF
jgi:hypothetical protein